MTRTGLATIPNKTLTSAESLDQLDRLVAALEALANQASPGELELMCFTPAQAARLLGKTENWVIDSIQNRRIPFTYVGKSPRMTAAHIRWVQAHGEVKPSRFKSAA